MAAGITQRLCEMKDVLDMLEAWEAVQARAVQATNLRVTTPLGARTFRRR